MTAGVLLFLGAFAAIVAFTLEILSYREFGLTDAITIGASTIDTMVVVVGCVVSAILALAWSRRACGAAAAAAGAGTVVGALAFWPILALASTGNDPDSVVVNHPLPFLIAFAIVGLAGLVALAGVFWHSTGVPAPAAWLLGGGVGALSAIALASFQWMAFDVYHGRIWRTSLAAIFGLVIGVILVVVGSTRDRVAVRTAGLIAAIVIICDQTYVLIPRGDIPVSGWWYVEAAVFVVAASLAFAYAFAGAPARSAEGAATAYI